MQRTIVCESMIDEQGNAAGPTIILNDALGLDAHASYTLAQFLEDQGRPFLHLCGPRYCIGGRRIELRQRKQTIVPDLVTRRAMVQMEVDALTKRT